MFIKHSPTAHALESFGARTSATPLPGGQGASFLCGDVVLKPVDDAEEAAWMIEVHRGLIERKSKAYRVAPPVLGQYASPPSYIVDGWCASRFISGVAGSHGHWAEALAASRALHRDLRDLVKQPPDFLLRRQHRWAVADRVVWDEEQLEQRHDANPDVLRMIRPWIERLVPLKRPLDPSSIHNQLIHGDLTGNVMFVSSSGGGVSGEEEGLPAPGIIDFSPYWRPVEFAEAILVADGLVDHGEGKELIHLVGRSEFRVQMLVRALLWRVITFAIQSDLEWISTFLPTMDFGRAVDLVVAEIAA